MERPAGAAWLYLRDLQAADAGRHFSETFEEDVSAAGQQSKQFLLDLWSSNSLQIMKCGFPIEETTNSKTIAMRMAETTTVQTWFLAIYRTGTGTGTGIAGAPLEAIVKPGPLNTWEVTIRVSPAGPAENRHYSIPQLTSLF